MKPVKVISNKKGVSIPQKEDIFAGKAINKAAEEEKNTTVNSKQKPVYPTARPLRKTQAEQEAAAKSLQLVRQISRKPKRK